MWDEHSEAFLEKQRAEDMRMECLRLAASRPDVNSPELILEAARKYEAYVSPPTPTQQGE